MKNKKAKKMISSVTKCKWLSCKHDRLIIVYKSREDYLKCNRTLSLTAEQMEG